MKIRGRMAICQSLVELFPSVNGCSGCLCWTHPCTRHLQEWDISPPRRDSSPVEQPMFLSVHHHDTSLGLRSFEILFSVVMKTDYSSGWDRRPIVSYWTSLRFHGPTSPACPGPSGWLPFLPVYWLHHSAWCCLQTGINWKTLPEEIHAFSSL